MYQSVIRCPGGSGLVRVLTDGCGLNNTIVNGSVLLVPAGTKAFVVINGEISHPYGPGRYEIYTGIDPFFVRLRNVMTRGDAGVSVYVFFISTEKCQLIKFGTGEMPFTEQRFQITLNALASCNLIFAIENPNLFLEKLIGSYNFYFDEEEIEICIEQLALGAVREVISKELGKFDVHNFNGQLHRIGKEVTGKIKTKLSRYGMHLVEFNITAINIPAEEKEKLNRLEQNYAEGKNRIDLEEAQLKRIWNGNVDKRTLGEMMTGFASRGQNHTGQSGAGGTANGGMASSMMQMMMMAQLLPNLREPLNNMCRHTDMFNENNKESDTRSTGAPPPLPGKYQRCPSCNGQVLRNTRTCPICGFTFEGR